MDLDLFFEVGLEPGSVGRSGVGNIVVDAEVEVNVELIQGHFIVIIEHI